MREITLKNQLHRAEAWLRHKPDLQAPRLTRFCHGACRVAYAVTRDIASGHLTLHAMSLVYTTLLSIVPLLALSFSVLKAMGMHNKLMPFVLQFLEPLGSKGVQMADQLLGFVDNIKVGVLGSLGLGLLVFTVISLVQKIEGAFNSIWRVPQLRSLSQRFSNYLSVIMVGPLLMVSAIGVTATIFSSSFVQSLLAIEPLGSLMLLASRTMPFFLVIGAFTFVYVFMPNTKVALRSALIGGLIAGVAWQLGGVMFASLVVGSAQYEAVYSSFAIGIVLLIWLYLSWLILLIGSAIAFHHQHPSAWLKPSATWAAPELDEKIALALVWLVARNFDRGAEAPQQSGLEQQMGIMPEMTRRVSDKLIQAGILQLAGEQADRLVPARSLTHLTLHDVLAAVRADHSGLSAQLPGDMPAAVLQPQNGQMTWAEILSDQTDSTN